VPALDRHGLATRARLEQRHWWFRGRRIVLEAALSRVRPAAAAEVLDLGAGTGATLDWLAPYGAAVGVEVNPLAVAWARSRGHQVELASAEQLPFDAGRFDLITCLDVLEHVADDAAALAEARRVAASDALLLVTAPAYPHLFAGHDVAAGHRRRYRRGELLELARAAGWRPQLVSHFNAILLPIAVARRLFDRTNGRTRARSDLWATPAALDGPLRLPLQFEAVLLRRGLCLPAGLSILAALRPG